MFRHHADNNEQGREIYASVNDTTHCAQWPTKFVNINKAIKRQFS